MICPLCRNERSILNKEGICVFCSHPKQHGTEIRKTHVEKTGGEIVKVIPSKFLIER